MAASESEIDAGWIGALAEYLAHLRPGQRLRRSGGMDVHGTPSAGGVRMGSHGSKSPGASKTAAITRLAVSST